MKETARVVGSLMLLSSLAPGIAPSVNEYSLPYLVDPCIRVDLDRVNFSPPHGVCIEILKEGAVSYEKPGIDLGELDPIGIGIMAEFNNIRLKKGLPELNFSPFLMKAANLRIELVIKRRFYHDSSELSQFFKELGVWSTIPGEVLGKTNAVDNEVVFNLVNGVNGFMNSPEHVKVILDPSCRYSGISGRRTSDGFYLVTVFFAPN